MLKKEVLLYLHIKRKDNHLKDLELTNVEIVKDRSVKDVYNLNNNIGILSDSFPSSSDIFGNKTTSQLLLSSFLSSSSSRSLDNETQFGSQSRSSFVGLSSALSSLNINDKKKESSEKKEITSLSVSPCGPCLNLTHQFSCRIAYLPDPVKTLGNLKGDKTVEYSPSLWAAISSYSNNLIFIGITVKEIQNGRLLKENFDCLVVPGGYAPNYSKELGKAGKEAIIEYVENGGGYLGICAGAYLGTRCASKKKRTGGLNLLPDVSVMDYEHWARGRSNDCILALQPAGRNLLTGGNEPKYLRTGENIITRYCNGPLLVVNSQQHNTTSSSPNISKFHIKKGIPLKRPSQSIATFLSDYTHLAIYGKEVIKPTGFKELPRGIMNKTSAIVSGHCHQGRVVLISPHLEDGEPLAKQILRSCLRWCCKAKNYNEQEAIDIMDSSRWLIRESWLASRIPKYKEKHINEDRANALQNLLRSSVNIPRAIKLQ